MQNSTAMRVSFVLLGDITLPLTEKVVSEATVLSWTISNGYLRKGQKSKPKRQKQARERKEHEEKVKAKSQKVKVNPDKVKVKGRAETKEILNGPTRTHLMGQ
ncbi:hypothetical protein Tco_0007643, partial [Tanacetum coccineum]